MKFTKKYSEDIEKKMKHYYDTLSEKEKRLYAAIETLKLGYGSQQYICKLLKCDPKTVKRGLRELDNPPNIGNRIRSNGGGNKRTVDKIENIDEIFLEILENYTAGDPMNPELIWTNLSYSEIKILFEKYDIYISVNIIKQLFQKHNFKKRQLQKKGTVKHVEYRNDQFENIERLKNNYINCGTDPIISIDVKKKSI